MKVDVEGHARLEPGASASALLEAGDLLDAGVLATDDGLVVRGWNRWFAAASGWRPDEVIGRPLLDVFPQIAGSSAEESFRRALAGETVVRAHRFHEYLLPLPPGPAFPDFAYMQQSARIAPLVRGDAVIGVVALVEDVTERVAREEQLRRTMEEAQAASRAKSDFIAAMSHELRTPLGAIIGYADILEGEIAGPLSENQKQHVHRVKVGAWHLMGIIEEILTFSRVEAGREELHLTEVATAALVHEACALVEPQAAHKGLSVRLELADLPTSIETDTIKLRQILVNLLGNAVKFTDHGRVELRASGAGDRVVFEIRDTGPGISADNLDRIFEPFTQIDYSLTRVKGGSGLGLAVSQRLAGLLGGEIQVRSVVGEGSTFTLHLPVRVRPG